MLGQEEVTPANTGPDLPPGRKVTLKHAISIDELTTRIKKGLGLQHSEIFFSLLLVRSQSHLYLCSSDRFTF
jgi:hypothetical protein